MDYTPITSNTPAPQPSYELTKDVTGEPVELRSPRLIKDKNGIEVKLPYAPKANCKRCHGRGYLGFHAENTALKGRLIICRKCYPKI